jgi:hypothetical protein
MVEIELGPPFDAHSIICKSSLLENLSVSDALGNFAKDLFIFVTAATSFLKSISFGFLIARRIQSFYISKTRCGNTVFEIAFKAVSTISRVSGRITSPLLRLSSMLRTLSDAVQTKYDHFVTFPVVKVLWLVCPSIGHFLFILLNFLFILLFV